MKKLYVNHFAPVNGFSNGVMNYIRTIENMYNIIQIHKNNEDTSIICFDKKPNENQNSFQKRLTLFVVNNFHEDEVIIEAAESQSSTLFIPRKYGTHIRMHCPFYLYRKVSGEIPDQERFSTEIRAMNQAKYVSSPSHGMLKLLDNELNSDSIHVFKNPIDPSIQAAQGISKDIDVIILLRFNKLKGIEYINPILKLFPENYNVFLLGKMEQQFSVDPLVNCNITILEHVEGDEKFELLQRAKTSLSLSKFENCSMVILESLATNVPVVCWDVGGNSEIAKPPVVNVVEFEDIFALANRVIELVKGQNHPSKKEFQRAISDINYDFQCGMKHLEDHFLSPVPPVYKGLDFSPAHHQREIIPYELRQRSWKEIVDIPFNILALVKSEECLNKVDRYFEDNCKSIYIGYSGVKEYYSNSNYVFNLDYFRSRNSMKKLIQESKPDIILIEDLEFSNWVSRTEFIQHIKKPIIYLFKHGSDFIFDKNGSYNKSLFRNRRINANMPSVKHEKNKTICAISFKKETARVVFLASKLREALQKKGIEYCHVIDGDGESIASDMFFRQLDSETGLSDVTDIFVADSMSSTKYIELIANIYLLEDDLIEHKNVAEKIDLADFTLKNDIETSPERSILVDLIKTKSLKAGNPISNFDDLAMSCFSQNSHKAMPIVIPNSDGQEKSSSSNKSSDSLKIERAKKEIAIGYYRNAIEILNECVEQAPSHAHTRRVLAEALINGGRLKEAIAHLEKSHELLPDNKPIKRRLDYLKHPVLNMLSKGKKPFPIQSGS